MQNSGQKRPSTDSKSEARSIGSVCEVTLAPLPDTGLNFNVDGGSDNGQFAYVTNVNEAKVEYLCGKLNEGDILLNIQGQNVAGYTRKDTVAWLNHCCRSGNPVSLKTAPAGFLTRDLCQFLNSRFLKGSVDHDLQNTIRDNLYLRTVPVTTREPREGEVNGVDYTFLTLEQFQQLVASGSLLESGIYEGNHYGTPRPSKEPHGTALQSQNDGSNLSLLPGAHPSSEGKRRRNRSNVEAMASKSVDVINNKDEIPQDIDKPAPPNYYLTGDSHSNCSDPLQLDLGPLPPKWEKAYTDKGEVYFIDHNSSTSHWLDPRLSKFQKKSLEDCSDDELPYGWERIDDPLYGTYYIDHVNRQTQYENPVIQAKNARGNGAGSSEADDLENNTFRKMSEMNEIDNHTLQSSNDSASNLAMRPRHSNDLNDRESSLFTLNPNELIGERIHSTLVKSMRGLGFTIVGGDDSKEEFLQIKSVVPNGPAWLEGKLQTGDVLVYVNDKCVLGYTHHDMVTVFQNISPGETVKLEVCRGYPLPFDPNDPNTEVVTTVAVGAPDCESIDGQLYMDQEMYLKNNKFLDISGADITNHSVKSLPDLYDGGGGGGGDRPASTDLILDCHPQFLTMSIVKGAMGFGFTIADSAYGQKVKKILDRQRCKTLMEGDILVEINNINVRNMCHSEVVQVLKDCTRNEEATISVQRGGLRPLKKEDAKFRSKTPTTELYGTRPKEVIAGRPKTPLVDTRNRVKTPIQDGLDGSGMVDSWNYQLDLPSEQAYTLDGHLAAVTYYPVKKKETTSFEHEQPHSSVDTRYPYLRGRVNPNVDYAESVVTLLRQETGFGFRIVGGTEEGSQVSIGHIDSGGAADLDGRLCTGDEIVTVDSQSVINTSHHHVVQLMGKAAVHGRVTLGIRRRIPVQDITNFMQSDIGYPYDVTVKRRENEGFGFVIISSLNKAGSTIGRIIEGSPAERCGQLRLGDHILAVNHIDIMNLSHGDIVNLIKDSGYSVTLTIGPPLDDTSSTASITASHREEENISEGVGEREEEQYHAVELNRGNRGFGFSIRGGREFQNMALFVLQIAENGPAALDGRLKIGDQIIEINGINTKNMTHSEAIEIIRNGGPVVRLLVKRGGRIPLLLPGVPEPNNMIQSSSVVCMNGPMPGTNGGSYWENHYPSS
ncbi:membrane-associated guanylate kinase, WW and PDZ domain-containing protein 2 [Nilaparvata lugens]|uniref:membrane-associated guanylate kinase, WW and PDZ domain-containing protein 2 n=2 Tax=Nilaparvata lugens TaxID=108931 RepID=UPI00193DD76E|nr:membrane-associated guanylate kinase, WW and PDZ domain-containing protein 2 [Nilaparvata lugens]